jgi:hypothetical protein
VIFYVLTFFWFLVGLWLRFLAHGALRGAAYDVLLVTVLASATFCVRNQQLVASATAGLAAETLRRSQIALNRSSVAAWVIIAEARGAVASRGSGNTAGRTCRRRKPGGASEFR